MSKMEWKTIDTAPRDGETVILWASAWDMSWGIVIGHFEGDGEGGGDWVTSEGCVSDNDPDYDPDEFDDELDYDDECGPTHWMPLPEPPK